VGKNHLDIQVFAIKTMPQFKAPSEITLGQQKQQTRKLGTMDRQRKAVGPKEKQQQRRWMSRTWPPELTPTNHFRPGK